MDAFHEGLWRQPELIVTLPDDVTTSVLEYLISMACEAQHIANIEIGRRALVAIPLVWLSDRLHQIADRTLNLADDWECRRLIELYSLFDNSLAERFAKSCVSSSDTEIAEAGQDFLDEPNSFAETSRQSLGKPLP